MRVLVVTRPFGDYPVGVEIADPASIAAILASDNAHRVVAANRPEPAEPATVAPRSVPAEPVKPAVVAAPSPPEPARPAAAIPQSPASSPAASSEP